MRALLPQLYDGDHAYAVDVSKVDDAFSAISRVLNGGLDEGNFSDSLVFANETATNAVPYSFAQTYSRISLRGQIVSARPGVLGVLPVGCSLGGQIAVSGFAWAEESPSLTMTFKVGSQTIWTGPMNRIGDPTGKYVMVETKEVFTGAADMVRGQPNWFTVTTKTWIGDGSKHDLSAVAVLPLACQSALEAGGLVTAEITGGTINKPCSAEITFTAKQVA